MIEYGLKHTVLLSLYARFLSQEFRLNLRSLLIDTDSDRCHSDLPECAWGDRALYERVTTGEIGPRKIGSMQIQRN